MTQYEAIVTMSPATVTALTASGDRLYVFRAVQASDLAGRPVVWTQSPYSARTSIGWTDTYDAYTSTTPVEAGDQISVGYSTALEIGQQLDVRAGGTGDVKVGHHRKLSILNTTSTQFTCGIAGDWAGHGPAPYCAFPLYGNNLQTIQPILKILLTFSTQPISPGTIIDDLYATKLTSFTPAILIDFRTANERAVGFDINAGWSWGGYAWATQVASGTDLVPRLIQRPQSRHREITTSIFSDLSR